MFEYLIDFGGWRVVFSWALVVVAMCLNFYYMGQVLVASFVLKNKYFVNHHRFLSVVMLLCTVVIFFDELHFWFWLPRWAIDLVVGSIVVCGGFLVYFKGKMVDLQRSLGGNHAVEAVENALDLIRDSDYDKAREYVKLLEKVFDDRIE